jgi:hypothetical protein
VQLVDIFDLSNFRRKFTVVTPPVKKSPVALPETEVLNDVKLRKAKRVIASLKKELAQLKAEQIWCVWIVRDEWDDQNHTEQLERFDGGLIPDRRPNVVAIYRTKLDAGAYRKLKAADFRDAAKEHRYDGPIAWFIQTDFENTPCSYISTSYGGLVTNPQEREVTAIFETEEQAKAYMVEHGYYAPAIPRVHVQEKGICLPAAENKWFVWIVRERDNQIDKPERFEGGPVPDFFNSVLAVYRSQLEAESYIKQVADVVSDDLAVRSVYDSPIAWLARFNSHKTPYPMHVSASYGGAVPDLKKYDVLAIFETEQEADEYVTEEMLR